MNLQIAGLEDFADRIESVHDTIGHWQAGPRVQSDAVFSQPFVDDHTAFESFDELCAHSPWSLDEPDDIRNVPRPELDAYLRETTEFESFEEMETLAAEEEIIDQVVY
ncbi:MAG: hypothetical protein ABEI77_03020 [Halorientalis sp.]